MMLVAWVLSWMLLGRVAAHWKDERIRNETGTYTGFNTMNMTCNDAGTVCEACYPEPVYGEVYLHTAEYAEGPAKFLFRGSAESRDWVLSIVQDDPTEPFLQCMMQSESTDWDYGGKNWRFSICMDNQFSDISVPTECQKPLGVVSMVSLLKDKDVYYQRTLFCAARPNTPIQ